MKIGLSIQGTINKWKNKMPILWIYPDVFRSHFPSNVIYLHRVYFLPSKSVMIYKTAMIYKTNYQRSPSPWHLSAPLFSTLCFFLVSFALQPSARQSVLNFWDCLMFQQVGFKTELSNLNYIPTLKVNVKII